MCPLRVGLPDERSIRHYASITGYRNDSPYSVTRQLRDAHSAGLMIGNERIHAANGAMHLTYRNEPLQAFTAFNE